jgi:hypothetical protein
MSVIAVVRAGAELTLKCGRTKKNRVESTAQADTGAADVATEADGNESGGRPFREGLQKDQREVETF